MATKRWYYFKKQKNNSTQSTKNIIEVKIGASKFCGCSTPRLMVYY